MSDVVWKCVYPYVFGHSRKLSLNKFFAPSTPSMRKGRYEKKNEKKLEKKLKIMKLIVATNVVASRLPERRPTGNPTARANLIMAICSNQLAQTMQFTKTKQFKQTNWGKVGKFQNVDYFEMKFRVSPNSKY